MSLARLVLALVFGVSVALALTACGVEPPTANVSPASPGSVAPTPVDGGAPDCTTIPVDQLPAGPHDGLIVRPNDPSLSVDAMTQLLRKTAGEPVAWRQMALGAYEVTFAATCPTRTAEEQASMADRSQVMVGPSREFNYIVADEPVTAQ